MHKLRFKKIHPDAIIPTKAYYDDLGWDLFVPKDVAILPATWTVVDLGIACKFPEGIGGIVRDRSSIVTTHSIFIVAGIIDPQYTGELKIVFMNPTRDHIVFDAGSKVAQMILMPVIPAEAYEVNELPVTARADGGFGSTGA